MSDIYEWNEPDFTYVPPEKPEPLPASNQTWTEIASSVDDNVWKHTFSIVYDDEQAFVDLTVWDHKKVKQSKLSPFKGKKLRVTVEVIE